MSEQKKNRKSLVLQSAVAGGVATAVLLGGFGAFSMWNDTLQAGTHDISTGVLALTGISDAGWKLIESDGIVPAGTSIDPATFKASPGDVLQYTANVGVQADASDMVAELRIDPTSYAIAADLVYGVTVDLTDGSGNAIDAIPVDGAGGGQTIPVNVTVAFSPSITGKTGQNLDAAVTLNTLAFELDQLAN